MITSAEIKALVMVFFFFIASLEIPLLENKSQDSYVERIEMGSRKPEVILCSVTIM